MPQNLYREINRDSSRKRLLKYTRKAFKLLPKLDKPRILDVGCGSGVQTLELARLSKGEVVGIDINQSLIDEVNRKIRREGFSNRVKAETCSVVELDFPDESFDVIWVEAAIHAIGFEKGLKKLRPLLKPNGFLVLHEEMRKVSSELEETPSLGYQLMKHFLLPADAHWVDYYEPLESRIKGLREKHKDNSEALKMLKQVQDEIDMVKENPSKFRSAFYIMKKI